jgi:hypothetical protein
MPKRLSPCILQTRLRLWAEGYFLEDREGDAMPKAGMCAQCGSNVWLNAEGGCVNGHDASQITDVYEADAPEKDSLQQAGDDLGEFASNAEDAVKKAWDDASPAAKEAADAATETAQKAADAMGAFGKKLFDGGQKRDSGDPDIDG